MRKKINKIIFLVLIFNCYSITAQIIGKSIVGIWLFDFETSMANINEMSKKHYDKMQGVSRSNFEKAYKGRKMIFNQDGSFLQQQADGKQIIGKWLFRENEHDLIITSFNGDTLEVRIERVSNSTLVLKPKENQNGRMLLSEWYFIKI